MPTSPISDDLTITSATYNPARLHKTTLGSRSDSPIPGSLKVSVRGGAALLAPKERPRGRLRDCRLFLPSRGDDVFLDNDDDEDKEKDASFLKGNKIKNVSCFVDKRNNTNALYQYQGRSAVQRLPCIAALVRGDFKHGRRRAQVNKINCS